MGDVPLAVYFVRNDCNGVKVQWPLSSPSLFFDHGLHGDPNALSYIDIAREQKCMCIYIYMDGNKIDINFHVFCVLLQI